MPPNSPLPSAGQESLLTLLFEQAPGFIALLEGPNHLFTLVNPAYYRLVGPRELIGKPAREAVPEAVHAGFIDILDKVFSSGEPFVGRRLPLQVHRVEGAKPERRFLDFVYQPLLGRAGAVAGIFCEGHDVTEEVDAERRAHEEAEKRAEQAHVFETVLSSIEDFAYTFDLGGRFTYSNKPLLDLLVLELEAVVGKTFSELPYPPELAARLNSQIRQVVETGRQVRGEAYYKSPSGKEGWYEYIFNPVIASDGSVSSVAGSTRDVTLYRGQERQLALLNDSERAARSEAERASRLKDEFLATLSHELRTPLHAIQNWADLLRSGRLKPDQAIDAGERISRNSRAQGQLIADLLDMNGITSGKVRLTIERGALAKPLFGAIDAVKLEATKKNVVLQLPEIDTDLQVDCDPDRLQQVFWNLLTNAVKFTPAGGVVGIRVQNDESSVSVEIADTGIGVRAEFLPHLFERFSQADSSSTRNHGGLGLGLAICKSLVDMHDGQISASSEGAGKGTKFLMTLPLQQQRIGNRPLSTWGDLAETELPRVEEALELEGTPILVVDDDRENLTVLTTLLQQYGAIVSAAGNADEAFEKMQLSAPALVICDIGMPVVDGYQLLWRIRKHSNVPVIAFTAFARPEDKQRALDSGFAAHIAKPAAPATTIKVCARVLAAGA
ncbi:MAG: ATP-binding protein [Pseudomonadota bacterium]|nr:ATP-binding protein [Pseudomonadota bacterium]